MALDSEDREDLLRDAKGLPERGQFSLAGDSTEIVIGFRKDNSASWYFGPDPVFQFDPDKRLRRIFLDGERYAVANQQIIHLAQEHRGGRIRMQKQAISQDDQLAICSLWQKKIAAVQTGFANQTIQWAGTSVDQNYFQTKVLVWLRTLSLETVIASTS